MKFPKSDLDKINMKAKFIKALEIQQKLDSYVKSVQGFKLHYV